MPYKKTADLPEKIRKTLPVGAHRIYLEVFNNAWRVYSKASKRATSLASGRLSQSLNIYGCGQSDIFNW